MVEDSEISTLRQDLHALEDELSLAIGSRREDVDKTISIYREQIIEIEGKFKLQENEIADRRITQFGLLEKNQFNIANWESDLAVEKDEQVELRKEINQAAANIQVYRLAMRVYGRETAADLEKQEVALVTAIWFGSVAAIVAFAGVILALASYVLEGQQGHLHNKDRRSFKAVRRSLVAIWRYSRRTRIKEVEKVILKEVPVEIIKEIPVEKIRIQEVPKEIIKKTVVHVPMFTNDKELLNTEPIAGETHEQGQEEP